MNSLHKSLTALLEKLEENGVLQKEEFTTVALKQRSLLNIFAIVSQKNMPI